MSEPIVKNVVDEPILAVRDLRVYFELRGDGWLSGKRSCGRWTASVSMLHEARRLESWANRAAENQRWPARYSGSCQ